MAGDTPSSVFREHFTSSDLGEVEDFFSATYADITMRPVADSTRFGCRHDVVGVVGAAGFTVSRMRTSVGYGARLHGTDGQFVVASVRAGGFSSVSEQHGELSAGGGDTALTPPVGDVAWVSDPIDADLVALDGADVAAHAAHTCGSVAEDLRVTGLSPISPARARHWNATVAHVRDDLLGSPVAATSPIVVDSAFGLLAAALLSTFPNTALAGATDPGARRPRGAVSATRLRAVVDYLDAHAHRPVGPADVAAVADAPARDVVAALHRHDTSPARRLWQARLRGVRRDLRDADAASGATVAAIAARWGFTHGGRFRVAYAKAFDEQPEETLRR